MKTLRLSLFLLLLAASPAQAGSFSLMGGAVISKPQDGESTFNRLPGPVVGALWESNARIISSLNSGRLYFLSYELGVLYFKRLFSAGVDENTFYFAQDQIHFQGLIRVWFGRLMSAGIGGFGGYAPGQISYTNQGSIYKSNPITRADYGVVASLRASFRMPLPSGSTMLRYFVEARYSLGFANVVSQGQAHYDDYQIIGGIRFGENPFDPFAGMPIDYYRGYRPSSY